MTNEEKELVRSRLESAKLKTQKLVDELKDLTKPISPENSIGRISRMDAINNKSVNEASLRNAESKLAGIFKSLELIDEPDFGLCAICRNPIPVGRLVVMPGSYKCVKCSG